METLTNQLEQLESAQLVRRVSDEDLSYLFKHALTQESAYASLLVKTRRDLHRRIAQAYETLDAEHLDELAPLLVRHYAEAGDHARVAEYALRAGAAAANVYAHIEARAYWAQALDAFTHLPDSNENRRRRADTLIEYLKLTWASESIPRSLEVCAEAERLVQTLIASEGLVPEHLARLASIHYGLSSMHMIRNELPWRWSIITARCRRPRRRMGRNSSLPIRRLLA